MMVMGRIESSVWSSSSINLYIVSLPWWYCCSHLICEPKCCWCAFIFLKKRFVFFVPSCSCFQTLLPKCTVYSIYIFYIKISLTTVSYNWFAVLMLYLQQMNGHGGLHYSLRGCSVFWWVYSSCNNISIDNISVFWCDWSWRSAQVHFWSDVFQVYKGQILPSAQSITKCHCEMTCMSVSCCSGVTVVWRLFSMQILCYSTICVHFILYEKNILNFVPNCKIEELNILRLYVNCYILCIPE